MSPIVLRKVPVKWCITFNALYILLVNQPLLTLTSYAFFSYMIARAREMVYVVTIDLNKTFFFVSIEKGG